MIQDPKRGRAVTQPSETVERAPADAGLKFNPRFDVCIAEEHDVIIQAEDDTCFYYRFVRLTLYSKFFSDLVKVPKPSTERPSAQLPIIHFASTSREVTELALTLLISDDR